MVKKLLKQEFKYYMTTVPLIVIMFLGLGVMNWIIQFFESDSWIYNLIISSTTSMLYLGIVAGGVVSTILIIVRFYKNMFSSEGYLTFTLPVSNAQHILVKLLAAIAVQSLIFIAMMASALIVLSGNSYRVVVGELFGYIIRELVQSLGVFNTIFYILEFVLIVFTSLAASVLSYYACMTVGQMAKKNRILLAVGCYFGLNAVTQVLGTVFSIILLILSEAGVLDAIGRFMIKYPVLSSHSILVGIALICAAIAVGWFFLIKWLMTKKLNLE